MLLYKQVSAEPQAVQKCKQVNMDDMEPLANRALETATHAAKHLQLLSHLHPPCDRGALHLSQGLAPSAAQGDSGERRRCESAVSG